jgi:hypothetical protein
VLLSSKSNRRSKRFRQLPVREATPQEHPVRPPRSHEIPGTPPCGIQGARGCCIFPASMKHTCNPNQHAVCARRNGDGEDEARCEPMRVRNSRVIAFTTSNLRWNRCGSGLCARHMTRTDLFELCACDRQMQAVLGCVRGAGVCARQRQRWLVYAETERFSKCSRIHCVVTDLGRSMGRPRARSHTSEESVPSARLTPKSTV